MKTNEKTVLRATQLDTCLGKTLQQLGSLQERVLRLRYGIGNGGHVHAAGEVARRLGMNQGRVRRVEIEAIGELRIISLRGRPFNEFERVRG